MKGRRRLVLGAVFVLGLVARLWALSLWGTFDTEVQKAWAARAVSAGVADIYGPPDDEILERARGRGGALLSTLFTMPLPRTTFQWGSARYFVDYPPGSVLVLWTAGRLWAFQEPDLPNRKGFNAAINLAPLVGSIVIALLLARSWPSLPPVGRGAERSLVFWLNPAVLLAAPVLGYQDTVFGAFALGSVLALAQGRHAVAAALVVFAGLVKPQGALLLPTLVAVVLRERPVRVWLRAGLVGALAAAAVLFPWWSQGHLISALDGCRRPLGQGTLAPLGLNLWWIAGWLMDWDRSGPWPLARIVSIDAFSAWAGWDPRLPARLLLGGVTALNLWWLVRRPREERWAIPLSVVLQVHAYALLGTSVHENHTFLAVILAPLLLGAWVRARVVLLSTSAFLFVSLFFAAGLGRRVTRLATIEAIRAAPGLDLSVLVAAAHAGLVVTLFVWALRCPKGLAGLDGSVHTDGIGPRGPHGRK